jgi:hypothetical protein
MNDETPSREMEVVEQLRRTYVSRGYDFIAQPRGKDVPNFLSNQYPDAIARSKTDNVVLEIKSSYSESDKSTLVRFLASEVPKHKGWRFELVIDDDSSGSDRKAEPSLAVIGLEIDKVGKLLKSNDLKLGVIAGWALLEALSRKLVFIEKSAAPMRYKPQSVIEGLVSDGFVSDEDGSRLVGISKKRNQLVHGFTQVDLDPEDMKFLLNTIQNLRTVASENEDKTIDHR